MGSCIAATAYAVALTRAAHVAQCRRSAFTPPSHNSSRLVTKLAICRENLSVYEKRPRGREMTGSTTRVDMHCHSTASEVSKLGVQRALGLPECATPPEEVYELAKRRGMDFVTITDHDTIDGVLTIAGRRDVFVSAA